MEENSRYLLATTFKKLKSFEVLQIIYKFKFSHNIKKSKMLQLEKFQFILMFFDWNLELENLEIC